MTAKKQRKSKPTPPTPAMAPVAGPVTAPVPPVHVVTEPIINDSQLLQTVEGMLRSNPRDATAWSTLGVIMRRRGRTDEALICYNRALEYEPGNDAAWSNLGNLLTELGHHEAAATAHARALNLSHSNAQYLFNALISKRKAARYHEALLLADQAIATDPQSVQLRWERALIQLQIGNYQAGLKEYEYRRQLATFRTRPTPGTPWDGGALQGKRIFLSTEQGFGDTLMAARYVPLVKARGGRVLFECHPELRRVLGGLPVDEFVPAGGDFPAFDVQASQMSLPYLLGTTINNVPPPVSLHIPPEARAKATRVLGPVEPGCLRVGIIWSGRVTFADNARRATSLSRFLRFGSVPGVRLYSLQKGPPEEQLDQLSCKSLVTPLGPHIDDFADTAAFLEQLDLVIMTDSSTAHLAGSLGVPIWNLIQYMPYWIYGESGRTTPWYPSMRLFRQTQDHNWDTVFDAAMADLRELAANRRDAGAYCGL